MFGIFGRKKAAPAPGAPAAPGWDAIAAAFARLHPRGPPRLWRPQGVARMHDLRRPPENPLDAVGVWDAETHWHYVTFGLTDLYEKVAPGPASGLGHELTFRLAKSEEEAEPPRWPIPMLIALARAELGGDVLGPGHTIATGPIGGRPESELTALLVVEDGAPTQLETPHGRVAFLLVVGIQAALRERALREGVEPILAELRSRDPSLVTHA